MVGRDERAASENNAALPLFGARLTINADVGGAGRVQITVSNDATSGAWTSVFNGGTTKSISPLALVILGPPFNHN
jgi:hypothetical protein